IGRQSYWGAWYAVFLMRPENQRKPGLREIFANEANSNTMMYETEAECQEDIKCSNEKLVARSMNLMRQAGIDVNLERLRSFAFGLIGGQRNELHHTRELVLSENGTASLKPESWI